MVRKCTEAREAISYLIETRKLMGADGIFEQSFSAYQQNSLAEAKNSQGFIEHESRRSSQEIKRSQETGDTTEKMIFAEYAKPDEEESQPIEHKCQA